MPSWPVKQRELQNHHFDSTIWNDVRFRDDDIVIGTYAKSGTTWVQQIVACLLFADQDPPAIAEISPWLDLRVPPASEKLAAIEAQTHRRFLKTHLPVDALVYAPTARYLYIARDGRDVVWSLYNHHSNANDLWYQALNETPGLVGAPIGRPSPDVRRYFRDWLDGDGYPFWSFWDHINSWWTIRNLPNLLLLHYEDLLDDLPGQMRRIAAFLDIPIDERQFPRQVQHCGFAWMKAHASDSAPLGGAMWNGGAETFIHKGTNRRWRDVLPAEDSRRYDGLAREKLGAACAAWLAIGAQAVPEPGVA